MLDEMLGPDGTWPMPSASGPCRTWPTENDCGCLPPDAATWDATMIHSVEVATEILWRLTAGQYGLCREVVRPCTPACGPGSGKHARMRPDIINGQWINMVCGCPRASDGCSCGAPPSSVHLPGPVYWEDPRLGPEDPDRYRMHVYIDGQRLPGDAYWMYGDNQLIRTDGGTWPTCQDLTAKADEPGAFAIVYWRGTPVPPGGRRAVALLACEIWKACAKGPDSCALPRRVQTVQREGITYTMLDPMDFLDEGRVGLTEVDLWLASVNPGKLHSPSVVLSPDMRRHRSEWTGGSSPPWMSTHHTGGARWNHR